VQENYSEQEQATSSEIDLAQAARFLAALAPGTDQFTFQTFDDDPDRKDRNLVRVIHGSLGECAAKLKALNLRGAGVFVTVNETNLKGRKAENITKVRALFKDQDKEATFPSSPTPHIVVESSPNRQHDYWLVDGVKLEEFTKLQKKVIARYGSDPAVHDLPRVMRLPGFLHQKYEPFLTRIVAINNQPLFKVDDFNFEPEEAPEWTKDYRGSGKGIDDAADATPEQIKAALAVIDPDLNRQHWFPIGCVLFKALGEKDGFTAWTEWSRRGRKYKEQEMDAQWRSIAKGNGYGWTVATLFWLADKANPDWRRTYNERQRGETGEHAQANPLPAASHHGEVSGKAERMWLIKSLLPETGVALLSGQWGTAKTFTALEIAGSVLPDPCQERFIDYRIKRRGGVLFIAAEGSGSIRLRFEAMLANKLGRSLLGEDNPKQPFGWLDFQPMLLKRGAKDLITIAKREAAWMRATFGEDLVLIIIDTIVAAAAFQREDDAAQGQAVMAMLAQLSAETGALVLGVDHFGKDVETGTRGTSAKEAAAESILALIGKREVTGKMTDLRMGIRKVKDGEQGRIIPFRLERIDCGVDEDGDAVTTCVVHWEPERESRGRTGRPPNKHGTILAALHRAALDPQKPPAPKEAPPESAEEGAVRDEFKRLIRTKNEEADLTDNSLKKRWQRAKGSALRDGAIKAATFEGGDFLWEAHENF